MCISSLQAYAYQNLILRIISVNIILLIIEISIMVIKIYCVELDFCN